MSNEVCTGAALKAEQLVEQSARENKHVNVLNLLDILSGPGTSAAAGEANITAFNKCNAQMVNQHPELPKVVIGHSS